MQAHRLTSVALIAAAATLLAMPSAVLAQEQEEEQPGQRYVAVTIFEVPLGVRDKVFPYLEKYLIPMDRLNPHVKTFRVFAHNWGSNGSDIVFYREYEEFADIEADCGQPCEEYQKEHPQPEEGDEGYEEFKEAERLFEKYFGDHHDEIFVAPMGLAKTEGEIIGTVGPSEEESGGN